MLPALYTSKNACLQGHFCEAVNTTAARSAVRRQPKRIAMQFFLWILYRIFLCASNVQMVSTVYILLLLCSNSLSVSLYVLFCDMRPHFSELFIVSVLTFQLKSSII